MLNIFMFSKSIINLFLLAVGLLCIFIGIYHWYKVGFSFASMYKEVSGPVSWLLFGFALSAYSYFNLMIFSDRKANNKIDKQ